MVSDLTGCRDARRAGEYAGHPKVHGGILFPRGDPGDRRKTPTQRSRSIDLVVVNLYPSKVQPPAKPTSRPYLIENIDIAAGDGPVSRKNFEASRVVPTRPTMAARRPPKSKHRARGPRDSAGSWRAMRSPCPRATGRHIATELERPPSAANGIEPTQSRALSVPRGCLSAFPRRQELALTARSATSASALYVPGGESPPFGLPAARHCKARIFPTTIWGTWNRPWRLPEFSGPPHHRETQYPCRRCEQDTLAEATESVCLRSYFRLRRRELAFHRPPRRPRTPPRGFEALRGVHRRRAYDPAALEFAAKNLGYCNSRGPNTAGETRWELKRISGAFVQEQDVTTRERRLKVSRGARHAWGIDACCSAGTYANP